MKWTIRKLRESKQELLSFDEVLDIAEQATLREASIIHLEPVHVSGYFVVREQDIVLHCTANVVITLPSTRTLEPVEMSMNVPIKERYVYPENDVDANDYEEITLVLEHDYIDLEQAVLESILLNLPQRVVSEAEEQATLPKGNDWAVLTEDEYQQQQQATKPEVDPRLAKLQSLLNANNDAE
ncbi:DUF177 domain-containing protein [Tuanshanicoccus lijuaniae]|uniref:YceD family protein n=1 Tax=Aerococcaceae bacterium zg-1292 TaxID=2774330 RepID=UPI001938C594|nr:DUF177 domain-containing protein [Aerococcaceae bacterium zg-1292]MBF6978195.1 DUF177 domain-containing protein [Aerococcaceae bacterium zg-BR22]MBS4456413.1 DUF177 domain-containing protein [Aerococcaceae bacterium zg-A91]MBS4458263.1 DUF177 domain-containing protein [Aerococcaceae bacterium zg-BR33]QQA37503.1 DUF177 domain-containing protein [Aerococcaceae bacterium zg-1292]